MERGHTQPLLRTVMSDGTIFLFVIEADDSWTIRRNNEPIAHGQSDKPGIAAGTKQFCQLTRIDQRLPAFA
jgi:hypothetical protein